MQITVLCGGPSAEREVSLISGRAVIDGLRAAGHEVFVSDISPTHLSGLDHPCDVVFPVLHGAFGESGELQEILEHRGVPFVGSGSVASRLGMDKVATKQAWQRAGLPTPEWQVITRADPLMTMAGPCVVKPIDSGSSIDVAICHDAQAARRACEQILQTHQSAMVERLIEGPELTVGLLEERPLDPIRIIVKREFFDYDAKYKGCGTEHHFELGLPDEVALHCRDLASNASRVIGCRDLARVDIMLDDHLAPHLLEINTLPGFTPTSLLPEAAAHGGISFTQLVDRLVRRAHARGGQASPKLRLTVSAPAPRAAASLKSA